VTTTITSGTTTFTPILIRDYQSTQTSGNLIHELLGGEVDVTLREASTRSGSLQLLFPDEATAQACRAAHASAAVFELHQTDATSVEMTYVVDGRLEVAPDEEAENVWWVTVEYRELV